MITYPVDPEARFNIYNTVQQAVVRFGVKWPRADGMQIVGGNPDETYLEVKKGIPPSDMDGNFFYKHTDYEVDLPNEEYRHVYSAVRHEDAEILQNIENVELNELTKHFTQDQINKYLIRNIAYLWLAQSNQALTNEQKLAKRKFLRRAAKIDENESLAAQYKAQALAGQTPDIEAPTAWAAEVTPEEDV